MEQPMGTAAGGIFFVFWLIAMIGIVVGYIIFLVAMWRGTKAHESIAETLKQIAQK